MGQTTWAEVRRDDLAALGHDRRPWNFFWLGAPIPARQRIREIWPRKAMTAAGLMSTAGGDWNQPSRAGRRLDQPQQPKQRWKNGLEVRYNYVNSRVAACSAL